MYEYSIIEYEYQIMDEMIQKEMQRTRDSALRSLSSVVHFQTLNFTRVLAYAWFDSQPDAIKLSDDLNLSKLDFLAVNDDFEGFKEEYLSNQRQAENF